METALAKLERVVKIIVALLASVSFGGMVTLAVVQVFCRFILKSSIAWSDEGARILLVFTVFFGLVLTYEDHMHVCVSNLVDAVPKQFQKVILVISYLITLAFNFYVIYGFVRYAPTAAFNSTSILRISFEVIYACIPISCVLVSIFCVRDMVQDLRGKETAHE